uniref:Uncharacterized protein n=1 Tax=Rhizophora mucronata TaxID=61149 RepID=A0A2P2M4M7_RHIMU
MNQIWQGTTNIYFFLFFCFIYVKKGKSRNLIFFLET